MFLCRDDVSIDDPPHSNGTTKLFKSPKDDEIKPKEFEKVNDSLPAISLPPVQNELNGKCPMMNNNQQRSHSFAFGGGGCPYLNDESANQAQKEQDSKKYSDCYYHQYLQLDKILTANKPRSSEYCAESAHDEHLFITIHQSYELWFKQILFELDSCVAYLGCNILDDRELLKIVSRFQRINKILKLLVEQFTVLDTMTPMNFLDFRKYLKPASGFQSVQFRLLENKLGLSKDKRMRYNKKEYTKVLTAEHEELVKRESDDDKSLFVVLERWLERFPYLESENGWYFWTEYKNAVNEYILEEKQLYLNNVHYEDGNQEYKQQIEDELDAAYKQHVATFNVIFDEKEYEQLRKEKKVRLSYTALQAALMIMLYREEPVLQMPFKVLEHAMEMDMLLTKWRNAHAQMVHRMLGSKMGTGGSSGFHYLRTAAIHHKVFGDFFNLSTYMIPKSNLPSLPHSLTFFMNFPSSPKSKSMTDLKRGGGMLNGFIPPFATISRGKSHSTMKFAKRIMNLKRSLVMNKSESGQNTNSDVEDSPSYEDVE